MTWNMIVIFPEGQATLSTKFSENISEPWAAFGAADDPAQDLHCPTTSKVNQIESL